MYSLIDYGPLNIFSAALLATDGASVFYYSHTALQMAKALRQCGWGLPWLDRGATFLVDVVVLQLLI